jgi:outer membrane protein assembly factor BamE (lipoprotein component of BamABCDE complex)
MTFFIIILTLFQHHSVDLVKIQGSTKDEIVSLLGRPIKIESYPGSCKCDKVYYLNNQLYIVYFQDKVDMVWCKTSKVTILNFDKAKVMAFHRNRNQNEVTIHLIHHQEQKCCDEIHI